MPSPTTDLGNRAHGMVIGALMEMGCAVLVPLGEGLRYDFVIDHDGAFLRVQSKYGVYRKGSVVFQASSPVRGTTTRISYRGSIDFFGVACTATGGVYLVPVGHVREWTGTLRVDKPRNGQSRSVRWASQYDLRKVVADRFVVVREESPPQLVRERKRPERLHGSPAMYRTGKCRCEPCTAANRRRTNEYRTRVKNRGLTNEPSAPDTVFATPL